MSNILGPGTLIELLDRLKTTVADLTARADKLTDDFRSRLARERLRQQGLLQEREKDTRSQLQSLEERFAQAEAAEQARYEARKKWIGSAFQSSKEQRLREIDDGVGARKYEAQRRMLQADRDREAGLSQAAAHRKEFLENLAAEQGRLANLERSAQHAFTGFPTLKKGFFAAYEGATADSVGDHHAAFDHFRQSLDAAGQELKAFRTMPLVRVFRHLPLWIAAAVCVALVPLLSSFGVRTFSQPIGFYAAAAVAVCAILLHLAALFQGKNRARQISAHLATARRYHDLSQEKAEEYLKSETARIQGEFTATQSEVETQLRRAQTEAGEKRVAVRLRNDEKAVHAGARNDRLHETRLKRVKSEREAALAASGLDAETASQLLQQLGQTTQQRLETEHEATRETMAREWESILAPIYSSFEMHTRQARELFPPWLEVPLADWTPPDEFHGAAQFGALTVDLPTLTGTMPKDKRLVLPGPAQFTLPLALACPQEGSLVIETTDQGHDAAVGALNNTILRLLATNPPGRLAFTILDPVGLGQNFAGVMHMADYEEQIINNRIWTQSGQIEQRLADLNEHMEKVIQMYLRNEYDTIAEYNRQAGVIAEKYHFLVVADFPANFSEMAAKRLLSIAASGARCGVYMLLHWDRRLPIPQDFMPDELRKNSFNLVERAGVFIPAGPPRPGVEVGLENPPPAEAATTLVHRIGQQSRDSSRVEVPFEHVAPTDDQMWSENTTSELRVAIGRTGATKLQYLALGKGTCQHGLVAGKTGSGKSTLFHVIITNLSLWCSPEQVEFYLVDFKKGVEFKIYGSMKLPHARVVAIESDREFGLSVLQRVDDELRRRGDLFRKLGVQDIAGYKRAGGRESIPRSLLLIDEFQEFFVEDDKISQTASLLLDRIVRQGRAFGIHVLLGSQTLGGAYTVARTTLGQMVVRIALQCNEADAYLIMDDSNPAPRLLSRPGEGIYNDTAGSLEGNSPFQVVWLPDATREKYLRKVRERAGASDKVYSAPIVFEGNAPADVRDNSLLAELLSHGQAKEPAVAARLWLGAPNSIKGPTEVVFKRQSGNNLLFVGQREESVLAMLGIGLIALGAQYPSGAARFILLDGTAPGSPERAYMEKVLSAVPHSVQIAKSGELPDVMSELREELRRRGELPDPETAPAIYLVINGLQRYNRLRHEEEFSFASSESETADPAAILSELITEGPRLGIHVIAACDTYNNAVRYLSRKALSEFELRVLFQMSANDSASLIDNPRASSLGLHRALYSNAQEGWLETFRPYALPEDEWVAARNNEAILAQKPEEQKQS